MVKPKFQYPNIRKIFEISENKLTPQMLDFEGLSSEQSIVKMKENIKHSYKDRLGFIQFVQRESKKFRAKVLSEAKYGKKKEMIRSTEREKCKRDPLYFFNVYLRTYNPRLQKSNLPFITYPFQDEFIHQIKDAVEGGYDIRVEKTRDMGFSRVVLGVFVWGFIFHDWTTLVGSYKEKYVHTVGDMDSAFERVFFMINKLPNRMVPNDIETKFMSVSSSEGGEKQIGGDSGASFGTGGRRRAILGDEFALRQNDKTALRKTKDVTDCRIFGGTPEGTSNVYGKVMTNHKDYIHMQVVKIRLHWKKHPLKTQYWYEVQQATRLKIDLAKEIDISYDDSVTGAVYPNFKRTVKFGVLYYNPKLKLYRSYDFGLDSNVCIRWQKDFATNTLYIINAVRRENRDIRMFTGLVKGEPNQEFADQYDQEDHEFMASISHYGVSSGDYGDPYNSESRTTVDKKNTIASIFHEEGIELYTETDNTPYGRIRVAKLALRRIHVHEELHDFIQSIIQSKRPKRTEGSQTVSEQRKPVHDGNSHHRTAFEYFLDNEPESLTLEGKVIDYSKVA